jgi:energy-coupling factor transporter ATP-binding protein EcfA2
MYVRLAFAVAAHLDPEILIVDEVLAVGDADFQKKCLGRMSEMAGAGRTVLFVSHNMAAVTKLCSQCAFLAGGRLKLIGPTDEIIPHYLKGGKQTEGIRTWDETENSQDPRLKIHALRIVAPDGTTTGHVDIRKPFTVDELRSESVGIVQLYARRFTVLHEEVDMGRLVDRAFVTFGEEARRRGIDYRCAVDAKPVIVTDGDRVLQIISNLLSNAFRWTPDGGSIELELKAVNGTVCVAVDDSGPGIPAGERERIFRPFWSRDGGGTGLGLAIARELAAALGGEIRLKSSPERGSRFELVLPSAPE